MLDRTRPPAPLLLPAESGLPLDQPFTRAQAAAWGVPRRRVDHLKAQGLLRSVVRGVYAAVQAPDDVLMRASALGLVVPPSGVVTDRTAAWLHGVNILPRTAPVTPPPVEVFSAAGSRVRRPGVTEGERTLTPSDVTEVHGVRVTTPLRTALDLGRLLWRFDALAALDGFLRIGVDHDAMLAHEPRFKGYRGVVQLRRLLPLADGRSESPGESAMRLHWIEAGLPAPELQWWVHDVDGHPRYRLDAAVPELRFGAEYDGEAWHSTPAQRAHDAVRRQWLAEDGGWVICVFGKVDVYEPHADLGRALHAGIDRARAQLVRWTVSRRA